MMYTFGGGAFFSTPLFTMTFDACMKHLSKRQQPQRVGNGEPAADVDVSGAVWCGMVLCGVVWCGVAADVVSGVDGWAPPAGRMPYLQLDARAWEWSEWLVIPLRFLLLCSIAVPISLKVLLLRHDIAHMLTA